MRVEKLTCPLSSSLPVRGLFFSSFPGTGSLLRHQTWDGAAVLLWESGVLSYHQDISLVATASTSGLINLICASMQTFPGESGSPFIRMGFNPLPTFFPDISPCYWVTMEFLCIPSAMEATGSLPWFLHSKRPMPPHRSSALLLSRSFLGMRSLFCLPLSFFSQQPRTLGFHFSPTGQATADLRGPHLQWWLFAAGLLGQAHQRGWVEQGQNLVPSYRRVVQEWEVQLTQECLMLTSSLLYEVSSVIFEIRITFINRRNFIYFGF